MRPITRRTFLCQTGYTVLGVAGLPLMAIGAPKRSADLFPTVQDRQKPLLTLDFQDATSAEAANLFFTFVGLNHLVDKDVYGFISGLFHNVHFETALRLLLNTANPKLTYDFSAGVYHISLRREPDLPNPNAPPPSPVPMPIQPSDLLPVPSHPTVETMPRRVSGILLWADKPWGAILETGGPFTGEKHIIRENQLVPSGVPDEPHLWVRKIERESVILHRHNGKSLVIPLTDLTPFRVSTPSNR